MKKIQKVQVWIYFKKLKGKVQVLLLKTRPDRGSFWQPVTGHVEKRESFKEAALREAQEETGLKFTNPPRPLGFIFRYKDRRGHTIEEQVFSISIKSRKKSKPKIKIDFREHVKSRWTSIPRALLRLKYSSNKKALRIFEKEIRKTLANPDLSGVINN